MISTLEDAHMLSPSQYSLRDNLYSNAYHNRFVLPVFELHIDVIIYLAYFALYTLIEVHPCICNNACSSGLILFHC